MKPNLESLLFLGTNTYDAATTHIGLEQQVLQEINPVMNYTINNYGIMSMYGLKGVGACAILY